MSGRWDASVAGGGAQSAEGNVHTACGSSRVALPYQSSSKQRDDERAPCWHSGGSQTRRTRAMHQQPAVWRAENSCVACEESARVACAAFLPPDATRSRLLRTMHARTTRRPPATAMRNAGDERKRLPTAASHGPAGSAYLVRSHEQCRRCAKSAMASLRVRPHICAGRQGASETVPN